jgi:hypothetical protein
MNKLIMAVYIELKFKTKSFNYRECGCKVPVSMP